MRGSGQGWIGRRRWQRQLDEARDRAKGTALDSYYHTPFPELDDPLDEVPIIALDFESDGLSDDAALLEAGWTGLKGKAINLSTARRERIKATDRLQDKAVTIHQITDTAALAGRPESEVLAELIEILSGKAILAHCAQIEAAFLNAACLRQFSVPFVGRFICTMQLEERWFPRARTADGLRLGKLRASYGLPQYRAHDGLTDAIACGELFLAQRARRDTDRLCLLDVLMRS